VSQDAAASVPFLVALAAGVLSFLSPCVLPLIPSYVGFLTGMSADELTERPRLALLHRPPPWAACCRGCRCGSRAWGAC
jgi:cytochrome c biogenesis protein CcdA